MENLTLEQLTNIRKVHWAFIAKHYGIQITSAMRKEHLKNVIVESFVEQGVLSEEALPALPPEITETSPLTYTAATMVDVEKLFELKNTKNAVFSASRKGEEETCVKSTDQTSRSRK